MRTIINAHHFLVKLPIIFFIFIPTVFFSCTTYYELVLDNKNPTFFCYDASIQQTKSAIKNGLGKNQIRELSLYFKEDNRYDILKAKENLNDAYLRTFLDYMKSKIYYKENKPLQYTADFHLHLDSLPDNKTRVTISTINPRIITGVKPGIGDNLTIGASNFKSVPPSTIEEYEILLIIGKQLGQSNMPPCNYPNKDAKRKIKHKSVF